ncbi:phosphotransferase family protein [Amycolatopsis sp. NPDC051903]|uniref:phosphotransferase family protein n=1 Tax=Amycolatopsis sp. NPDC051903 TaxID=3363936 RepID=UPI0037ABB8B1
MPPASAALARATRLAGPSATLADVRPLAGGSHATTYAVRTANPRRDLILREFPAGDPAALDEERVLTALDSLGGLAPIFLARGESWVLISRLPGSADIHPADPHTCATQLGQTLARVHTAAAPAHFAPVFDRRGYRSRLSGPAAPFVDAAWENPILTTPHVLTHGDYQSGNVLWLDGTLTGVVDWEGAARGPAGYDVGWCRLDLYLLHGEALADVFLAAYENAIGFRLADPRLWDLWTLARSHRSVETWVPNYRDLGRADLTATELRRRHTTWTEELLRRHG